MAAPARSLSVEFNHPQWQAYQAVAPRRMVFYGWGRGVGKSWFTRCNWYLQIAAWDGKLRTDALRPFRGVRITVLMPTLTQFKDVHWDGLEQELDRETGEWGFLGAKLDRQRGMIGFPGGSWIKPFAAAAHNAKRARGMRTDILSGDEIDDIDSDVYDSIAVPWLSEPWSLGIELLGGTPTRGRHGLWWRLRQAGLLGQRLRTGELSEEKALELEVAQSTRLVFEQLSLRDWPEHLPRDPDQATLDVLKGYYGFHATYRDAPETVSPLAAARAKATATKAAFEREWDANPDAGEGLVYPFDEEFHVRPAPDWSTFREFHVGMDHGTIDAGVLLLCGIQGHGESAVLWILDEIYESGAYNSEWNARAKKWSFAKFWPDNSRPDRVQDLRSLNLDVGETDRGPGSIKAGIARVADLLFIRKEEVGTPPLTHTVRYSRLYIAPTCVHTIEEFGKYRYPKLPDGTFGDVPIDRWNHCVAKGSLVATTAGSKPIEQVTVGDFALTRSGPRRVTRAWCSGRNRSLWKVTTANGTLEATPEHRVWVVGKGWVRIDAVRYGDMMLACENTEAQSPSSSTAKPFVGTPTPQIGTSLSTGEPPERASCIEPSGRTPLGQFLMGTTSTTRTRTRSTTRSRTSNASPAASTSHTTERTRALSCALGARGTSTTSGHSPKSGTDRQTASPGTEKTGIACGSWSQSASSFAFSAGPDSRNGACRRPGSAATTAKRSIDDCPELTTSTEPVSCAAESSGSTGIPTKSPVPALVVASSSAQRASDVYDLTVDGEHEFFASGLLVHNCMDSLRYLCVGRFGRPQSGRHEAGGR